MFERSARFYDALYSFKDYEAEVARLKVIIAEFARGARSLLDVACGTGRHLELLRADFEVEGLDLDPGLLQVAAERLPGVALHQADMTTFDLARRFDVVTCLFSSIGYVRTVDALRGTISNLARHVRPGGVVIVEPWLTPENLLEGHVGALFVDEDDVKIMRMNDTRVENGVSIMPFHYLVGADGRVSHFTEEHRLGLFTEAQHIEAFKAAGLDVTHDREGLMGRGLYIASARAPT